ncbi:MAG: PAS domain S-box protein [Verrucomicrobiota bacterium]
MRNFFRRLFSGLRLRLLVLVVLASAPAVVLTLYLAREARRQQAQNWRQEAGRIVQLAAREEEELIGGTRQLLRAVAESSQDTSQQQWKSNSKKLLTRLMQNDSRYANLGVARTNGDILVSARPPAEPANIAHRTYFQRALYAHALSIGDYQAGYNSDKPSINFGFPVLNAGDQVDAVVFAALDLEWLNRSQYALTVHLPAGTTWTKIDVNGTILVRQPAANGWIGQLLPERALVKQFLQQKNGELEAADERGEEQVYMFASTRSTLVAGDLISILSIPKAVLYAEVDQMAKRSLALVGMVAGLALLLGWLGSDLLVIRPIRALVNSTARLMTGDFSARAGVPHRGDELGQLTRTFDRMAQTLEQRETDRQRAEKELRESEMRFRALVQNSTDVIGITDAQGKILYRSPSLHSSLGYGPEEVQGKNIADYLWPEDVARGRELLAEIVRTPGATATGEYRLLHRDGSCRHIECTLTNHLNEPAIGGVVFNYRDITERKEAGEKLRHYSHRLELLSRHLVEAQETERRRIARELHDEIGQSLTVTQIHLQALLQEPAAADRPARLNESLQVIDRVLEQVQDISLNLRPSMLDDLGLEATLRWYTNRHAALTGINSIVEIDPLENRLDPVVETECFRVAQEALTNIARHARAKTVTVQLTRENGSLHLRVRDDGVGFEVKAVRQDAVQGESLGLLSMEERAALAGGGLEFSSVPGQGAEVHAWFPLNWQASAS